MTAAAGDRPRRVRDVHPARKGLVFAWIGFTVTFGFLRLLTWLIHIHVGGIGNVSAGGVHLHHYLYGIITLSLVAGLGLVERSDDLRKWMGLALGIGLALVVDEASLLIGLKDVYWDGQGSTSVFIALGIIAVGLVGTALTVRRSPFAD